MAQADLTSLLLWKDISVGQPTIVAARSEPNNLVDAAARACRASGKTDEFATQFRSLVDALRHWLESHREKAGAAYLAVREEDLLFLVVQKNARFDADLSDSLTELDLAIANGPQFDLVDLEVLAVPPLSPDSLKSILSAGTIVYDAK